MKSIGATTWDLWAGRSRHL